LSSECASKKIKNWTIIGKDMDKSKVTRFLAHFVHVQVYSYDIVGKRMQLQHKGITKNN